jgi:hypothetical protein
MDINIPASTDNQPDSDPPIRTTILINTYTVLKNAKFIAKWGCRVDCSIDLPYGLVPYQGGCFYVSC